MYIMVKFGSLFGSLSVCVPLSENLSKICNVVDNAEFSSLSLNIQPKPMCAFSLFLCQHKIVKCKTTRYSLLTIYFFQTHSLFKHTIVTSRNFFHWSPESHWRPVQIKVPFLYRCECVVCNVPGTPINIFASYSEFKHSPQCL